jgi:chromosome segregation protein
MRLNQIEISGFKSFPERSRLTFDGGVTAIVGPNGCGKSNVIDAISWVLGEQSARSLRGERMEDIIFSGSDARRPTATAEVRLQLSQVTATLTGLRNTLADGLGHGNGHETPDNGHGGTGDGRSVDASTVLADGVSVVVSEREDDLDAMPTIARDVELGRRLYRSGESEYLIDGQVCRLRDVQDLLMDSGVGVKAYAVIEQGKIGQILTARPMERRQLLEEAAGVMKYKSRRRVAGLKLEAAQQNLTRVDDIVFEVEKQRGALKRQAAKARRYRRLREELRRWEKVQFVRKSFSLAQAIEDATHRLDATRQREQGALAGVFAMESSHKKLQIELAEADRGATMARDTAHAHELELGRRQQQIEFDKAQVTSLTAAVANGETESSRLEERRVPLQAELVSQRSAAARCDAELGDAMGTLQTAETAHVAAQRAIVGLEGDVEASRSDVFAAINAATALQHVVDNATAGGQKIAAELSKLEAESSDLETEGQEATSEREQVGDATDRVRRELEIVRLSRVARDVELASARQAREVHEDAARKHEQALASTTARVRSLQELVAARAGYSDAARLVLSQTDGALEHLGSVADHLDVDRQYERAVEACLGELVQYVVVASADDARAGIALAHARDAGRCGFVIVSARPTDEPATPPDSSLTPLANLVRIEGVAADTVRGLLRHRWFAPSFEMAAAAAHVTGDPITTPDGTIFEGPSIVHGGGKAKARGILATRGEIKELQTRIVAEEDEVTRCNAEVSKHAGIAKRAETELKTLQSQEHSSEKELLELELRILRLDEELVRFDSKRVVIENERHQTEAERDGLHARQAEARESIARLEVEQRTADDLFMSSQRKLLEARESVAALGERVTESKAAHAALAERSGALSADVRRLEEAAQDLAQRVKTRTEESRRALQRRDSLVATIAVSDEQLDQDLTRFDALRDSVRASDDQISVVRQRIEELLEQLRVAREALEVVRADVGRLDVRRATAEADLVNLENACQEVLQLALDQVRQDVEQLEREGTIEPDATLMGPASPDLDVDGAVDEARDSTFADEADASDQSGLQTSATDARTESPEEVIATLREKIERLGPVNMMAIDQFDELEERFNFLTTQRQDLLESIRATGDAIKRIDVTTRERFKEAFTAVNEHFQEIFSTLFGGGRAGLVLLDETDLLESGVDIIAQPPGKRLQSIQLLSGGEKALTAMALMFSIFKFKPSPFCLLDEIDAPLDDANIGRFVEMLRGMQDRTQFVLVTHNRKTMEIADRLYGVTMEEPGVSTLISVKLN